MLPYAPQNKVYKKQSASRRRQRGLSPENDDLSTETRSVGTTPEHTHSVLVGFIMWRGNQGNRLPCGSQAAEGKQCPLPTASVGESAFRRALSPRTDVILFIGPVFQTGWRLPEGQVKACPDEAGGRAQARRAGNATPPRRGLSAMRRGSRPLPDRQTFPCSM